MEFKARHFRRYTHLQMWSKHRCAFVLEHILFAYTFRWMLIEGCQCCGLMLWWMVQRKYMYVATRFPTLICKPTLPVAASRLSGSGLALLRPQS